MDIEQTLRNAIRESGLPMLRLSKMTGVERMSIVRFIRGDQTITLKNAARIAEVLGYRLCQEGQSKDAVPKDTKHKSSR